MSISYGPSVYTIMFCAAFSHSRDNCYPQIHTVLKITICFLLTNICIYVISYITQPPANILIPSSCEIFDFRKILQGSFKIWRKARKFCIWKLFLYSCSFPYNIVYYLIYSVITSKSDHQNLRNLQVYFRILLYTFPYTISVCIGRQIGNAVLR